MLDEIIRMTRSGPLVIVIGMRPGPSPAPASIAALDHIRLEGLDEVETKELAAVVAGTIIDESDAKHLHERTAGNPLFITETVRALLEDPPPMTPAGRLGLGDGQSGKGMPMTLRALLGARIDALSEEARTVLRVASVIGVTFRETIVGDVFGERVERDVYEGLGEASLIVAVDGVGGWRFSHPLIHDAAYSGLLGSSRRRLHARVADLLDAQSGRGAIGRSPAIELPPATGRVPSRCSPKRPRKRWPSAHRPRRRRSGRQLRTCSERVRLRRPTVSGRGRCSRRCR